MDSENTSIADKSDMDGIQTPLDTQPGGVPAQEQAVEPTSTPETGITAQTTSDAGEDFEARMAEMRADYDRNMRRMQASLQRNAAEQAAEYEQRMSQLESELHAARTATMNDQERVAYERDLYAQRAQMLENNYRQAQQRITDWEQASQAREAFRQLGIDPTKLPMGTVDQVLQSGWVAIAERMAEYDSKLKEYQSAPRLVENTATQGTNTSPHTTTAPGPVSPPSTAAAQGTPAGGRTWGDAFQTATQILGRTIDNEEDLIQAVEGGQLPPSILPGLG